MSIPGLSGTGWRTSSHSSGNGACVQVNTTPGSIIAVRQVTPAALRVGDLDRARAAHDAQRADQGARLRVRAGRQ